MRNQTVNLNLIPGGVSPVVHLSQFDQDADGSLIFNIYNGVVPYDLTDCVAHIQGHKPDDTIFDYECTVYATYVTAPTEYQMTVMAGQYPVELRISKNGASVGTANMIFAVEPSTGTGADLSHTDIPELVLQIEQAVVSSGASASAAEDSAEDAEAWAVGQINGSDVPNTDARYHNNSKYYAGQASTSATNAGNSETNAATSESNAEAWAVGKRNGTPVTSGDPAYHNNAEYYAGEADDSAEDSEAWAVGERDGVPVTSDDPTYHNNAKYWSQQSAHASVSTLTDVTLTSLADGDLLQYDSDSQDWKNVPQSSITPADMTGATSGAAGAHGLVPAPAQGDQNKVLTGGGTWTDMEDSKAYHTDDTAETTIADGDYFPFYDTSATAKRKSLWSNIKSVLKTYFDTLYSAKATSKGSATKGVYFDSNGAVQAMTYSVEKDVPSNAVFTDQNVLQENLDATHGTGYILFSGSSSDSTGGTYKTSTLQYDPYYNNLSVDQINGSNVGFAPKFTDTGHTILDNSGNSMTQQPNLQFSGLNVTNDSGNNKTVVTAPTPDYVDAPYNSTTTYTKGMTCISGNKRYRWINSAASTVPAPVPPNATYWEELSVAEELKQLETETVLWDSGDIAANEWTENMSGTGYWGKTVSLSSVYSTLKTALENHRNAYLEVRADSGSYVRYYRSPIYVASDMTIISATAWAFFNRGYSIDFGITSGHNQGYIYLIDNSAGTQRNMTNRIKIITLD